MVWDNTLPIEGALAPTYNNIMRADKTALEAALNAYFYFVTGGTQTMQPRQGSARVYYQAAAPATRLDSNYFDSTDLGTPWIDSDNNKWYFLSSADGAGTDSWTLISTEIIATAVAAIHTWAAKQTFSVSPAFTLGIVANNVYITGRNQAGSANINMWKINTSDGISSGAIVTLTATSLLATSAAPTTDAMIANKKYIDDSVKGAVPVTVDSDAAAMEAAHAYLTTSKGHVTAFTQAATTAALKGFVHTTTDPAGAGTNVAHSEGPSGTIPFISFHVGKGLYFEVTCSVAVTITWTPDISGGTAPVDQD